MPTKQIPFYGQLTTAYSSSGVGDASEPAKMPYYLNGFFERNNLALDDIRKVSLNKRPGTVEATFLGLTALTGLANGYKIQGMASSFDKTKLIFYVNNGAANKSYYFDGTTLTDKLAPTGSWTNTGPVAITQLDAISYGGFGYWAATDFTEGAVINASGTWTRITAAVFTGLTKVTNFAAMDGYVFIGDDRNRIYNSSLNAPTTWVATSFLTAADYPGKLMWLSRIKNYIVAFKQYSLEFFEDTGNPTPGSPLTAQKQLNRKVGLAAKSSVKEVSDGIIFLGISENGKLDMYKLMKDDLSLKIISSQFMDQMLAGCTTIDTAYSVDPKVTGTNGAESQVIIAQGKEWYTISLYSGGVNRTWVYDNDLDVWMRWATCMTANNTLDNNYTPTQATIFAKSGTLYNLQAQNFLVDGSHAPFFVTSSIAVYADYVSALSGNTFPLEWTSDVLDFGSRKRKFIDSVEVLYDVYTGATTGGSSTLTLQYRDADYATSGADNHVVSRTIEVSDNSTQRSIVRRLGSCRKRIFSLKHNDAGNTFPFRLWGLEVKYNIGETDQEG